MSEIKSRADLFEEAAKMMRMCDEAGIQHVAKLCGEISHLFGFGGDPTKYEFPLAIVEGKPVFKGDWLYSPEGKKFQATEIETMFHVSSWLPPKPKTVMVEMSVEDADRFFNSFDEYPDGLHGRIARACRKSLEELK